LINLLVVSGSPVDQSSTDIILSRIADTIAGSLTNQYPMTSTFVKLNELRFIPCQSCGEAPTPKFCLFDDGLTDVYTKLADCDCLLFGTPVYFDSVSAQAKMFIDRCNCFRPPDFDNVDPDHHFIRILKRKRPGAMVLVGGERGWFEGARRVAAGFFKWVEVTNEGMIVYRSPGFNRAGSVADDREALAQADALGRRLAEIIARNYDRP
jgi:multimeric flavodoxin WrbA